MITALLVLLAATNLATVAVVVWLWRERTAQRAEALPEIAEALAAIARQPGSAGGTRRVISVEILNPIELAGSRGRVAGMAGSLAPGITRRLVYDQAMKTMRRNLSEQQVVADVRLHTLRRRHPDSTVPARGSDGYVEVVEVRAPDPGQPDAGLP